MKRDMRVNLLLDSGENLTYSFSGSRRCRAGFPELKPKTRYRFGSRLRRSGYSWYPELQRLCSDEKYSSYSNPGNRVFTAKSPSFTQKLPAQSGIEALHELKVLLCRATDNRHPVISASSLAERPSGKDTWENGGRLSTTLVRGLDTSRTVRKSGQGEKGLDCP